MKGTHQIRCKVILFDAIKVGSTFMEKEMQGKEFPLPHGHFLAIAWKKCCSVL